jgi:hypothetical protein
MVHWMVSKFETIRPAELRKLVKLVNIEKEPELHTYEVFGERT